MAIEADISEDEYKSRVAKAQRLMVEHDFDALLLAEWEHIYYITGFMGLEAWAAKDQHHAVVLPRNAEPLLIFPEAFYLRKVAEQTSWTKEIRGYRFAEGIAKTIKQTFRELGLTDATIGTELGDSVRMTCIPVGRFMELMKTNDNEYVDATGLTWKLRMVKSREEIERIRTAARIASRAVDRAFEKLKDGMTEREFARIVSQFMLEEGATRPSALVCSTGDKFRRGVAGSFPGESRFHRRDYVGLDFATVYRHYLSDLNRTAYLGGQPPRGELDHYELYAEANKKGTDVLRPGIPVSKVFTEMARVFEEAGLQVKSETMGHGIGLEAHEAPFITPADRTLLEPGMVFAIEPYDIPNSSGLSFNCEDNVLVTETGSERLSTLPRELRTI